MAKIRFLNSTGVVGFSGNVHSNEQAFSNLPADSRTDDILKYCNGSAKLGDGSTEYILCSVPDNAIYIIKATGIQNVEAAWIGSEPAFKLLRAFETRNRPAPENRPNTIKTRILGVPDEIVEGHKFSLLFDSFANVTADAPYQRSAISCFWRQKKTDDSESATTLNQ